MEPFETTVNEAGDSLRIVINESKFDAPLAPVFKEKLEAVWSPEVRSVVIDFASVQFIDSSGIGALLSVQKKLGPGAEPLLIENAGRNVVEVIELLRLHRVFKLA